MATEVQTILVKAKALKKAIELQAWYDAMPKWFDKLGDRGHENIEDEIYKLLPDYDWVLDEVEGEQHIVRTVVGNTLEISLVDGKTSSTLIIFTAK